ncbi:Cwf15/Cwc15 cell cycle control protein [Rhizodiscina lignyota]|uniref:Cwf15/Cwc15 cell cycle control protein n=1 Tax=Rhizodiscina lignyota TaxID=1504668 RepID=A0A9P4II59_9PEZI|nr:Cwf15/Cwc15 cell cycle control protein [Rhizodiscina lignyota]
MTTAHRPTFDPARGKDALRGPAYHQRLAPAYTTLKLRQPGQGGDADAAPRDLRAELLAAEAAALEKKKRASEPEEEEPQHAPSGTKRQIEAMADDDADEEEDPEAKRRRIILEEAQELDADSDGSDSDDSSDEDEDEGEDETAQLMREIGNIKKERADQKEKEEAQKAAKEAEEREYNIARGNPLLNAQDFNVKRRWDEDVVFKNQARGTADKKSKEFVNDLLRSDFHKRFMSRYVR